MTALCSKTGRYVEICQAIRAPLHELVIVQRVEIVGFPGEIALHRFAGRRKRNLAVDARVHRVGSTVDGTATAVAVMIVP